MSTWANLIRRIFPNTRPAGQTIRSCYIRFESMDWDGCQLRRSLDGVCGPRDTIVSHTLHMRVGGQMRSNTWAIMESNVSLDHRSGEIVLTASAPYAGELLVLIVRRA